MYPQIVGKKYIRRMENSRAALTIPLTKTDLLPKLEPILHDLEQFIFLLRHLI